MMKQTWRMTLIMTMMTQLLAADLGVVGVVREVHAAAELGGELHHVEQRLVLVQPQVVVRHRLQLRKHFSRSMKSTNIICLKC